MNTQPEALRLADALTLEMEMGNPDLSDKLLIEAAAELRRLHQHELANELWHKKTEWVQNSYTTAELGLHRADVIKQRIDRLHSLNQELVEALETIAEYWNKDANHAAMYDACWYMTDTANAALAKAKGEA